MTTEFDEDPGHEHKQMNGGNFAPNQILKTTQI